MQTLKRPILLPSRGIDVSVPSEFIDPLASPSLQNIEVNRGIIRKRAGSIALGSSLGERIMGYAELVSGEITSMLRFGTASVQFLNKFDGTWSDVTGTPLTSTSEDQMDFAYPVLNGQRIIVFTNGANPIRKFTGFGVTSNLGGNPPLCKFLIAYAGYLLALYTTEDGNLYPARVRWSDTGNPEEWADGDFGIIDLVEDGENITGASLFGSYIAIHKKSSIYLGYGVSTSEVFRFERKSTGVGTMAHGTIKNLPNGGQIFLATDGLHIFDGSMAPIISGRVSDELREDINAKYVQRSMGIVVRELDEYWLCVPMQDQVNPETVYKYNYKTGDFFKDIRSNLTAISTYIDSDEQSWDSDPNPWDSDATRWDSVNLRELNDAVVFGDSSGNSLKRSISSKNDNTSLIDASFSTKDFTSEDYGGDTGRMMRWTGIQLWAKGDFLTMSYSIDGGDTWSDGEIITLGTDYPSDDAPLNYWFDIVSTRIRFRFQNSKLNEAFTIKKYFILSKMRESSL